MGVANQPQPLASYWLIIREDALQVGRRSIIVLFSELFSGIKGSNKLSVLTG